MAKNTHSCKELKIYIANVQPLSIIKDENGENAQGWLMEVSSGHVIDINYCPMCGKRLGK